MAVLLSSFGPPANANASNGVDARHKAGYDAEINE
jgi:hypothetical protein